MSIKFGNSTIDKLMLGNTEVDKVYLGSDVVYESVSTHLITPNNKNITLVPYLPTEVVDGGSLTVSITASGSAYIMPKVILVEGQVITEGVSTTISGKCTVLFTRTNDLNGSIAFTNVTDDINFYIFGYEMQGVELCFTAYQANSTVELTQVGSPSISGTAYSRDRITWTTFTPSETAGTNTIILANIGDKVYFRNNITANLSVSNYIKFIMSGLIGASGSVNSMYNATNFANLTTLSYKYCLSHMFYGCTSLTTAPSLPATTLARYCYYKMFYGCTSLTSTPELPATTLESGCYYKMFYGCTSLTSTPELPATTLTIYCYSDMFYGCTSLTSTPELPATTLAICCYSHMFYGCTSLTTAPSLPATTLESSCYSGMFQGCTSLTTAPSLPATTLPFDCYVDMFSDCTSLIVSDSSTPIANKTWRIPTSGTFTNTTTYNQLGMFANCAGVRSSDTMSGAYGESHTYYTQNEPV